MAHTGNTCKHTHTHVEKTDDYKIVCCNLCGYAIDIANYAAGRAMFSGKDILPLGSGADRSPTGL